VTDVAEPDMWLNDDVHDDGHDHSGKENAVVVIVVSS
jgi:hypothetical protein